MPTVGGTKFPYSKEGIAKAKAWAEMTGKPMKMEKKYQTGGSTVSSSKPIWEMEADQRRRESEKKIAQRSTVLDKLRPLDFSSVDELTDEQIAGLVMGSVGGGGLGKAIFNNIPKGKTLQSTARYLRNLLSKAKGSGEKNVLRKKLSEVEKKITKQEMQAGRKAAEKEVKGMDPSYQRKHKWRRGFKMHPRWTEEHFAQGGLASMGRRGDNMIRPVAGKPSHVNPIEANMIDKFGQAGQQFAQKTGSGTINPKTGLPEYSWFSKRFKPSKKAKAWMGGAKKELHKRLGNPSGLQRTMKRWANPAGGRRWWNKNIKPLGKIRFNDLNPYNNEETVTDDNYIDPNLFGARQRFGRGTDISGMLEELMGGKGGMGDKKFQLGGEVPEGRRMYGTDPRRKKYPMQTSTAGMHMRGGEQFKKGGKVKMPKGWHV